MSAAGAGVMTANLVEIVGAVTWRLPCTSSQCFSSSDILYQISFSFSFMMSPPNFYFAVYFQVSNVAIFEGTFSHVSEYFFLCYLAFRFWCFIAITR